MSAILFHLQIEKSELDLLLQLMDFRINALRGRYPTEQSDLDEVVSITKLRIQAQKKIDFHNWMIGH